MKRFSFKTFCVCDENREACEICAAVAGLKPVEPRPFVLLGDSGAGKTHLLCAIVDHVKEYSPRTALAYVTAKDFPAEVRALANNPDPVIDARTAMLLVDQFEKFEPALFELLGQVSPLFVGANRYLVIATKTHPADIKNLPDSVREIMKLARVLSIRRPALSRPADKADREQAARLQDENQALRRDLEIAYAEIARIEEAARDARADLDRWALRAQAILQQVELSRVRLAENEEVLLQQVLALQERVAVIAANQAAAIEAAAIEAVPEQNASVPPSQVRPWYAPTFPLPKPSQPGAGHTV